MMAYYSFKVVMTFKFNVSTNDEPQVSIIAGYFLASISTGEKIEPDMLYVAIKNKYPYIPKKRIYQGITICLERFGPVQKGKALTKNEFSDEYTIIDKDFKAQLQIYPKGSYRLISLNDCVDIINNHESVRSSGTILGYCIKDKSLQDIPDNLEATTALSMDKFLILGKELIDLDSEKSGLIEEIHSKTARAAELEAKMMDLKNKMQKIHA